MPYPRHYRLVMGGTLFSNEIWSCSLHQSIGGIPTDGEVLALATDNLAQKAELCSTWFQANGTQINPGAKLKTVKFNVIDSAGKYLDETSDNTHVFSGAGISGYNIASSDVAPPQVALVLSLGTAARRGPASHGRIFVPTALITGPTQFTPRIDATKLGDLLTKFKTLVDGLNDWDGVDTLPQGNVCTVSKLGAGLTRPVTSIRVGDLYDTQRRRRNKFSETYVSQDITS